MTATQKYELTFILGEKATEADVRAKADGLKAYIEAHGGSVTGEELWGRRELAYPIKKNRSGFYVTFLFDFPGTEVTPFERELQFDESVIRSLITKAYTTAQPGTLSPVAEEEAAQQGRRPARGEEKASAEEMLRRTSGSKRAERTDAPAGDALPEEERLKQLDETLEEILKDDAN